MHEDKTIQQAIETPRKYPGKIEHSLRDKERKIVNVKEEERNCKVLEESGVQTYLKIDGGSQKAAAGTGNGNIAFENQITAVRGPHFLIPGHQVQLPPLYPPHKATQNTVNTKPQHFKSLDNIRNITQLSIAPSQKTIHFNHPPLTNSAGVYQSHVKTQKIPLNAIAHQSNINDRRAIISPTRVNYANNNSTLFNSYIPLRPDAQNIAASKMAPCISERQFEHGESVNFWREKYEELKGCWQALRLREVKQRQIGVGKLAILEQKHQNLQEMFNHLNEEYKAKLDENQQYYLRIQELQSTINKLQLPSNRPQQTQEKEETLALALKEKEEKIQELNAKISELEKSGGGELRAQFQEKNMLVGLLKRENAQFQDHLQEFERRYKQEMMEMHEHMDLLQGELEHREAQLRQRPLKGSSMLRSQHSQIGAGIDRSFDNTRALELQAHISKLNAQLTAREQAFERELRQANLSLSQLAERLKNAAVERDQAVSSLQQKLGTMQSDLNKKQSALRNLRDEVAALRACPTVYSSAITLADHPMGDKEDHLRRDLQNLRRNMFQREREKMILRQKYEQLEERAQENEEALGRRKLENQELKRQLAQLDNLQHQHDKLVEVMSKKNAEIAEMKEMLSQKQQQAGDFQNLTNENNRLRDFMLKKNEQLSELAEKLFNQEKKARELEAAYTPQINHLQEQAHHLQQLLARKEYDYNRLVQHLQEVQGNYAQLELQLERTRHINNEYESLLKTNAEKIENYQQALAQAEATSHNHQLECSALKERLEDCQFIIGEKEQFEVKALKQIKELSQELQMRQEELQELTFQQTQLKEFQQKSTRELEDFEYRHGDLQTRCNDLETELKKCQAKLAKTEKELQAGKKQLKRHEKCTKVIDELKEKIALYEMKIITLNINRNNSVITTHCSSIFEKRAIYQLKEQNAKLQQQVRVFLKKQDNQKQNNEDTIRKRLTSFSNSLQSAIQGKHIATHSLDRPTRARKDEASTNREIQRLKQLVMEMQQDQLEQQNSSSSISPAHIELIYKEEITFYRTKNQELQQRVENLIKVNKQLKQALDHAINSKDSSMKQFYQIERIRLQNQIKQLKFQRENLQKRINNYENRLKEIQQEYLQSPNKTEISYNWSLGTLATSPTK